MTILIALAVAAIAAASPTVDASRLTLSTPTQVVEIDTGKLKGDLSQMAWAPDGQQIYLQTIERDRNGNVKRLRHYLLKLDGKPPKSVNEAPPWSAAYWTWKSAQAAPGIPGFRIQVDQQQKRMSGVSIPAGGDLAKGGTQGSPTGGGGVTGFTTDEAMSAAFQTQNVNVYTLRLKGEVIGEFVNAPAIPGLTFGWAPSGTGLVAYADLNGHVKIMDVDGRKQDIDAKSALLPAWTDDGNRLAFLDKTGRNKAVLRVVDVKRPE